MNVVKNVFPECTNLLRRFHIDKNVKAKCQSLVDQKNGWDYGSLVDCPSKDQFDDCLKKFEIAYSPWPMLVDYDRICLLGFKRLLHNSLGDLCSFGEAMNNMITLQHTEIKTSFEISTHVVGHVFKYKKLLGMVSRYVLNQIFVGYEHVSYAVIDSSCCGCVMRTTYGLPYACELARYVVDSIPLGVIHMFWRWLSLSEPDVSITEEMETTSKRFQELDVCDKVTLKSKLREIVYKA
ncbi:hypothetical protein GmHk_10G028872 [Glycine max]|nr:hypothetical protein GmHk_10G028872 [Glycine max]